MTADDSVTVPRPPASALVDDPLYRDGVVDLLGVLATGELMAFERLAADAALAPTLEDKAALASMASAELRHFGRLRDRIVEIGANPWEAMAPFVQPLEEFHSQTAPSDWLEGLVKAYVGDGFSLDFYREIGRYVDEETAHLVDDVCADTGHSAFAVVRIRAAIVADPRVGGRLALWGRRLMGEALSQGQRVAAERDALTALLVGGVDRPGMDLAEIGRVFARLTEAHINRMAALGLAS